MKNFKSAAAFLLMCAVVWVPAATTVEGIVEIAEEGDDYKVVAVNLMVDDTSTSTLKTIYYRIENNQGKGKELLELVDANLRVTGLVRRKPNGTRLLIVKEYVKLDASGSPIGEESEVKEPPAEGAETTSEEAQPEEAEAEPTEEP